MKNKQGFTLIELLAVIVVLAIILVIAIPNIMKIMDKSKSDAFKSEVKMIVKSIKYKLIEEPNYDFTTLTVDKLESDFKITSKNIESIEVTKENEKDISIVIYGKNNAQGLVAYGTNDNITLLTTDEYEEQFVPTNVLSSSNIHNTEIPSGYTAIYKIEDLNNIRNNLTGNYILMNDLDFNSDSSYQNPTNKTTYTTGAGWTPIGTASTFFRGILNGNNHVIKNLYINSTTSTVGLFRDLWSTTSYSIKIEKLGLENVNITGTDSVGALAGQLGGGATISNVYVTGTITGSSSFIGGIIGTQPSVSPSGSSKIENSYSSANITGRAYVGGIIGSQYGSNITISNCFGAGNITTTSTTTGFGGALLGSNSITPTNSYRSSNATVITGFGSPNTVGTAIPLNDLKSGLFTSAMLGWDTSNIWDVSLNALPKLGGTTNIYNTPSLEISSIEDLYFIRKSPTASYTLMKDLDFNNNADYKNITNKDYLTSLSSRGWLPIGTSGTAFSGILNGNNHVIKNLYINSDFSETGLFSKIWSTSSTTKVEKLGLENVNITGTDSVGGLTGYLSGATISNVYVTGTITGSSSSVGGIIGIHPSVSPSASTIVENSYNSANIIGRAYVGGIIGQQYGTNITIRNCFGAGNITTTSTLTGGGGALIGYNNIISPTNSYRSSSATVITGFGSPNTIGTSTAVANLHNLSVTGLSSWDITNIWKINTSNFPTFK